MYRPRPFTKFQVPPVKLILAVVFCIGLHGWNVWAQKAELVLQTGHTNDVRAVAFSPDGRLIASGGTDNAIRIWDASSGLQLKVLDNRSPCIAVGFSANGKMVSTGGYDGVYKLWDLETGVPSKQFSSSVETPKSFTPVVIAFSPDGRFVAFGGNDQLELWEIATQQEVKRFHLDSLFIRSITFSPDGTNIAVGAHQHIVKVLNIASGQAAPGFIAEGDAAQGFYGGPTAFSPDGSHLASAHEGRINIWDAGTGRNMLSLSSRGWVNALAFSADGKTLVSEADFASDDGKLIFWDANTGRELNAFRGHEKQINALVYSPDGRVVASASDDKTVKLWDAKTGEPIRTLTGTDDTVQGMKGAKLRENQFADVSQLFTYAQDTVPTMAKNIGGIQRPLIIMPDTSASFDIGKFTVDEQKQILLAGVKPLILRPNLQNREQDYDDLELTKLLQQKLLDANYVSVRGTGTSVVFVDADEMVDAVKPSGSYIVKGDEITVTLRLIRNKVPLTTLTVSGKVSEKDALITEIVAKLTSAANNGGSLLP